MSTSHEPDETIERLLRQSLKAPRQASATDGCLDPETLAAWIDGGLSGAALEMTQAHVADCVRCQSLLGAMARTNAAAAEPVREHTRRGWLPWLVPLTAAATAVALWVAVPREAPAPRDSAQAQIEPQKEAADQSAQKSTLRDRAQAPPAPAARAEEKGDQQASASDSRNDSARPAADALERREAAAANSVAAPAAAPPQEATGRRAAAPSVSGLQERVTIAGDVQAAIQVVSPEPSVRWRILGSAVQHSTDTGNTWETVSTGVAAQVTAGAAPSQTVCWLVGRGGLILRAIDGRSFARISFPEITDLSAVRATSASEASVSTSDGRTFTTADGGLIWTRR